MKEKKATQPFRSLLRGFALHRAAALIQRAAQPHSKHARLIALVVREIVSKMLYSRASCRPILLALLPTSAPSLSAKVGLSKVCRLPRAILLPFAPLAGAAVSLSCAGPLVRILPLRPPRLRRPRFPPVNSANISGLEALC